MARYGSLAALALALAVVVPARADDSRAREILEAARKAATSLESISYEASYLGDGALAKSLPVMDATVVIGRSKDPAAPRVRIEGFKTSPRARDATPFSFTSDGEHADLMDGARMIYFEGPDSATRSHEERTRLVPPYYIAADPFDAELKAPSLVYKDTAEAGGVKCHVIEVAYDALGRRGATLYIGVEDHIVRRVVWPRSMFVGRVKTAVDASESAEIFSARNVVLNPDVNPATFRQNHPRGYRVQQFIPARQTGGNMLTPGTDAPDWTLPNEAGKEISLKSLRGQVVVVDFWASWCGPCKMAMPSLQSLHDKYKDKPVKVFSVNCRERGGQDALARNYIKQKNFTYPQLFKGDAAANAYMVRGIPTMYVIGTDGKILHGERGFRPDLVKSLSEVIDANLKKTTARSESADETTKTAKAG